MTNQTIQKINDKLNSLSTLKKILAVSLLIVILSAICYLTTLDSTTTINYRQHGAVVCTETYINGELNSSPCEQAQPTGNDLWINEQPIDLGNLTLNLSLN
jgi:hypothetical protein